MSKGYIASNPARCTCDGGNEPCQYPHKRKCSCCARTFEGPAKAPGYVVPICSSCLSNFNRYGSD